MVMIKNQGNYYPPVPQYGGIPGYFPGGMPPFPPPWMQQWGQMPTWNQNMPDSDVGRTGLWMQKDQHGFGVDMNGDGKYQGGVDGILAFDKNNDGKLSKQEITDSNKLLKAFNGDFDLNGDGKVGFFERIQGKALQKKAQKMDKNHDGKLDNNELQQAGAKVGIDQNGDGKCNADETYTVNNIPNQWGGTSSIGAVGQNYTQMNNNVPCYQPPWHPPMPWQPPIYQPQQQYAYPVNNAYV